MSRTYQDPSGQTWNVELQWMESMVGGAAGVPDPPDDALVPRLVFSDASRSGPTRSMGYGGDATDVREIPESAVASAFQAARPD